MLYERLRWLTSYDSLEIRKEYKNTYIYKSLIMISEFDSYNLISETDLKILLEFTNEFIKDFLKMNHTVKDRKELFSFYKNMENKFKETSKTYLEKAEEILDELIKDNSVYMEHISTNPFGYEVDTKFYYKLIQETFKF